MSLAAWLWNKFGMKEDDVIDPSRRDFLRKATIAIPAVVIGSKLGIIEKLVESSTQILIPETVIVRPWGDLEQLITQPWYDSAIWASSLQRVPKQTMFSSPIRGKRVGSYA